MAARILAAADALHAKIQARPHRAALNPEMAAAVVVHDAQAGLLDPDAVKAVVEAAGATSLYIARARLQG